MIKPISLHFSYEEMVAFLEKRGYTVTRVEVSVPSGYVGNSLKEDSYSSVQVYRGKDNVAPWFDNTPGTHALEFVFSRELHTSLLGL